VLTYPQLILYINSVAFARVLSLLTPQTCWPIIQKVHYYNRLYYWLL